MFLTAEVMNQPHTIVIIRLMVRAAHFKLSIIAAVLTLLISSAGAVNAQSNEIAIRQLEKAVASYLYKEEVEKDYESLN